MSKSLRFGDRQFAIKEHLASRLHWDLRLHVGGKLLLSWVLVSSPHLDPSKPVKAIKVGEHNYDYLLVERKILPGNPGAGFIANWDYGLYCLLSNSNVFTQFYKGNLRIYLKGGRLRGRFNLKWVGPKETDWLWCKDDDEFVNPTCRYPNVLTPEKIQELENKLHPRKNLRQIQLI